MSEFNFLCNPRLALGCFKLAYYFHSSNYFHYSKNIHMALTTLVLEQYFNSNTFSSSLPRYPTKDTYIIGIHLQKQKGNIEIGHMYLCQAKQKGIFILRCTKVHLPYRFLWIWPQRIRAEQLYNYKATTLRSRRTACIIH